MKLTFRAAWNSLTARLTRALLGLLIRVPDAGVRWQREGGPYFGNELMTFTAAGRLATVELSKTRHEGDPALHVVQRIALSSG